MDRTTFQALHAAGRLPSPKGVALELMRLIQRENVAIGEIAAVISSDPVLTGRVIASANSASHYGHRPVISVAQALAVNGVEATSRLALGLSIIASHQDGLCHGFDYARFWAGSVVAALGMQAAAGHIRLQAPAEAFTLGLLHRIGVLALATLFPDDYGALFARAPDGTALAQQERTRYATDHRELGTFLLEDWGVPTPLREAIASADAEPVPDTSAPTRTQKLTALVRVAGAMGEIVRTGRLEPLWAPATIQAGALNGFSGVELAALWESVVGDWPAWARILALPGVTLPRQGTPCPEAATGDTPPAEIQPVEVPPASAAPTLRVLVVCGEGPLREQLVELLGQPDVALHFATTADAALKLAVADLPQLAILDWSAPAAAGQQVCEALHASGVGRSAYILAVSRRQGEAELLATLKAGADEFLALPVSIEVLEAHLRVARRLIARKEEVQRDHDEIRHYATELATANRRLQDLAGSDPLTGLPNRRYAMEHMAREWQSARTSGDPLACLMIDVDNFKSINDSYGHDVGDRVLATIAELLRASSRAQDVVCRIGGEEFLVVCRATDCATARRAGERLRSIVQAAPVEIDGVRHRISISVGVSATTRAVTDAVVLMKQADQALYHAKQKGRNRVEAL
jgi:diguanylate cyclase (GGDEF)-like protein